MKNNVALTDYLNRIGAEQINFRTYQVKEYRGKYYYEKALIRIGADGTISADSNYEPTKEEQEKIKKAWDESLIPKVIPVKKFNENMIEKSTPGSTFFVFYNKTGHVIFVQERCEPKAYLPWTYWSDGEWRKMQPDGCIPFWKPFPRLKKTKIMIHEGAKAAKAANEIDSSHPWFDELSQYEHWGLVGGTLSVRRADYNDIREEKCLDLVYVCDNDYPGRTVLQEFSKQYCGRLTGIKFDNDFPASWDMADDLPKKFFYGKLFIGPDLNKYKVPATFATEIVEPDKGRPYTAIRKTFCEEWLHCVTPEAFVHRDWPARIYGAKEFNNQIAPYSHTPETAKLVMKDDAGKGYSLTYDPSRDPGPYTDERGSFINTFTHCPIKARKGNVKPWTDFLEHLFPDKIDRSHCERWIATLISHPEVRMMYGMLLISETQGVGKSTLGEKVLLPLIGALNTSVPTETQITESQFNDWLAHRRLAVCHEIYSGNSWRAYNRLKTIITDQYITVNKKYMQEYRINNWIHIIAMSNSTAAVRMSPDDRRWLVPKISEKKKPHKYWVEFNRWLIAEGGLQIIKYWADTYKNYVTRGEEAPASVNKSDVIEESLGKTQSLIFDVLQWIKEKYERCIITDQACIDMIADEIQSRDDRNYLSPNLARKVGRAAGWYLGVDRIKLPGAAKRARLLCTHEEDATTPWEVLLRDKKLHIYSDRAKSDENVKAFSELFRKFREEFPREL